MPQHKSLMDLSDEHVFVGTKMAEFERLLYSLEDVVSDEERKRLSGYIIYLEEMLLPHFKDEEEHLYVLIRNLPEKKVEKRFVSSLLLQLTSEHDLIRNLLTQLSAQIKNLGDDPTGIDWFIAGAKSLIDFIRVHSRKEDAAIYYLMNSLSEKEREALRESHRKAHSGGGSNDTRRNDHTS